MDDEDPKPITIKQALDLARAHLEAGRPDQTEELCRRVLADQPAHSRAWHLLGRAALSRGQYQAGADMIRKAIAGAPPTAIFYNSLGTALSLQGHHDEALEAYRSALQINPDFAEAHCNTGNIFLAQKKFAQAISAYRAALELRPDYAEAHNNLGVALKDDGRLKEAAAQYQKILELKPDYAEAWNNLGNVLVAMEQYAAAVTAYRKAGELKPDYAQAHNNLGIAHYSLGELDAAADASLAALHLEPQMAEAHLNLANALKDQGFISEALDEYRLGLKINPDACTIRGNLITTLLYDINTTAQTIGKELAEWNNRCAGKFKKFIRPGGKDRDPERRLRVGYVSPDLKEHAVSYFAQNLLTGHDGRAVEVFCYSDVKDPDQTTQRLREAAQQWRNITGLKDREVADLIRRDDIDILVDLAGHTAENRLMVFARKPAPVQVTYLGYPGSTGLDTMDYRFTDAYADPPGMTDTFYCEKLIRLPETFLCYRPNPAAPAAGEPPARAAGRITFGCFNVMSKINAAAVKLWAKILLQTPASRMLIKNRGLSDAGAKQHLLDLFAAEQIGPERLELHAWAASFAEHLGLYNTVDIALDTFPYNGTTTTCEALYMGVPVVVLAGNMHMSRVGVSLLSNMGLPELIAHTPEEYVQIAVKLADALPRREELRKTLRGRMEKSPLMDAKQFVGNVEATYREMWRKWCAKT